MRTKIILGLAAVLALATGLAYHVTQSDARWHILSGTAINTNRLCSDGLKYTWGSGATETQKSFHGPAFSPTSLVASPSKKLAMVEVATPVGRKKRRCGCRVKVLPSCSTRSIAPKPK